MIKIYSTDNCKYCKIAKEYLSKRHIGYEVVDVGMNPEARKEMTELSGQMGVPVIKIGEKFMVGWDVEKFRELHSEVMQSMFDEAQHEESDEETN